MDEAVGISGTSEAHRREVFLAIGFFVCLSLGLERLMKLPLQTALKDVLGVGPETMAAFFAIAGLATYAKPIAGALSDSRAFRGRRRQPYLMACALAGAFLWALCGVLPIHAATLSVLITAINVAIVASSGVLGGLMVEEGARRSTSGRLTALRMAVFNVVILVAGPWGGWLAGFPFSVTCATGCALMLGLAAATSTLLSEQSPAAMEPRQSLLKGLRVISGWLRTRAFLSAVAVTFLFALAPGFGTALFYRQQNVLELGTRGIGLLSSLNGGAGIAAALVYARFIGRRWNRALLASGIVLYGASSLLYVAYSTVPAAFAIEIANGFIGVLGLLPLQHMYVRAAPRGGEALGYALLLSTGNFGRSVSEVIGTVIMARCSLPFSGLVLISAAASALTAVSVLLLPRTLWTHDDHPDRSPQPTSRPR